VLNLENFPEIHYWIPKEALSKFVYVHSRSFVSNFENIKDAESREKAIYNEHIYIEKDELLEIIDESLRSFNFIPEGIGVELGAGCAAISVELALNNPKIEKIYAVEIVPEIVEIAQKNLIQIHRLSNKIIPVVGSFDQIEVSDNSIDFAVEFDSFHHSFDLQKTISESYRVLKQGGRLLIIDRSHWNASKKRRIELEEQVYSEKFLVDRGWDKSKKITRSDNGEHEYLLSEYLSAIKNAGFREVNWNQFIDPSWSFLKLSFISTVPNFVRKYTKYSYIQMWPIYKTLFPILLMKIFGFKKVGNFVSLPKKHHSKRFQSKTIICATK
jgi:ubiquinone/menaquinone biosynthesis C-methylase UbiE